MNKIYRLIIFSISFLLQNLCLESRLTDAYFFWQKVWSYLTHSVNRLSCKHANCVKMGVCLTPEDKIPFAKKNKTRQGFQMSIYAKSLRFLGKLSFLQIKRISSFLIHVYNTTFILTVTEPGGRRGVKLRLLKWFKSKL